MSSNRPSISPILDSEGVTSAPSEVTAESGIHHPDLESIRDLYPFRSHFCEVVGGRMHYVDEGEGPTLLMLHGNPTWSFYYRHLILAMRDRFRVIAPDHMGCGLSDKPRQYPYTLATHIENLRMLIEHLDVESLMLVVHDWGGPIGFGWATAHPDRLRGLAVLNTAAFLGGRLPWRIRICRWPLMGSVAILRFNAFARAATFMACRRPDGMSEEVKRGYLLPYDTPDHRIANYCFVRDIPLTPAAPSYAVVQRIEENLGCLRQHPMEIYWGMKDFCFTPRFLQQWRNRFPDATVHELQHAGHYVVEDAHERIVPLLTKFAKRVTSSDAT